MGVIKSATLGAILFAAATVTSNDSCDNGCDRNDRPQPTMMEGPREIPLIKPLRPLEENKEEQPVEKEQKRIYCKANRCLS